MKVFTNNDLTVLEGVSRVEVIDAKGRSYSNWNVEDLEVSMQDDGRTMKLFLKEK